MVTSKHPETAREEIEELRSAVTSMRAELRRMGSCIEDFRKTYEPLLNAMAASNTYWGALRRELLLHALKGSVWAMLAAVVVIVALGAKNWLKDFLA